MLETIEGHTRDMRDTIQKDMRERNEKDMEET